MLVVITRNIHQMMYCRLLLQNENEISPVLFRLLHVSQLSKNLFNFI